MAVPGASDMTDVTELRTLQTAEDFRWYRQELDVNGRYDHRHTGTPEKYPCKVRSSFWDDPNGPYTYEHEFFYQKEVKCEHCGHSALVW